MEEITKEDVRNMAGVISYILFSNSMDDREDCLVYLNECPERFSQFILDYEGKYSIPGARCDYCGKKMSLPYREMYHCVSGRCLEEIDPSSEEFLNFKKCSGVSDYCEGCHKEVKKLGNLWSCNSFEKDCVRNIYERYYLDFHIEKGSEEIISKKLTDFMLQVIEYIKGNRTHWDTPSPLIPGESDEGNSLISKEVRDHIEVLRHTIDGVKNLKKELQECRESEPTYEEKVSSFVLEYLKRVNKIDDLDECIDFLTECPQRARYFFTVYETGFRIDGIYCSKCKRSFYLPYKLIFHCIKEGHIDHDYCEDCYLLEEGCKLFHVDCLRIILEKFYRDYQSDEIVKFDMENLVHKEFYEYLTKDFLGSQTI